MAAVSVTRHVKKSAVRKAATTRSGQRCLLFRATPGWAASSVHTARTEETTRNIPTFAVNNAFIFSPSPLGDTRSCHIRLFHLSQYLHLPEPPPNSQHAPVLRNPPRPTATPPRRGAEHIPSRERNPPRPTATPPRRGVFPIPSLEGCRVSGGVGCPLPGRLRQAQDHPLRLGSGQASKEGITYKVTQYA